MINQLLFKLLRFFSKESGLVPYDEEGYEYPKNELPEEYIPQALALAAKENAFVASSTRNEEDHQKIREEYRDFITSIWPWVSEWHGYSFDFRDTHPYVQRGRFTFLRK